MVEIIDVIDEICEELIEIHMWKYDNICEENCYKLSKVVDDIGDLRITTKALACIEVIKEYKNYCKVNENNLKKCYKEYLKMVKELDCLRGSIIKKVILNE